MLRLTPFLFIAFLCSNSYAETKRPNILYILSDDHCSQAVSAYGGILADIAPTPNIDRLGKEGMLFKNCFVTNSICVPSRSAILTGKYSHMNGVYKFTPLDQSQPTHPKLLKQDGYDTALIGKWHLFSNPVGFDYWSIFKGQGRYENPQFVEMDGAHKSGLVEKGELTTYKGHSTDVVTDKALAYLKEKRPKDKPFIEVDKFSNSAL